MKVGQCRRHKHVDPSQQMVLRNAIIEAELVESLPWSRLCRPIIAKSPSPISSADEITVRRHSQRLYRQHRPKADIRHNRIELGPPAARFFFARPRRRRFQLENCDKEWQLSQR